METKKRKKGFTMVEIILAVAIIGIISAGTAAIIINMSYGAERAGALDAATRLAQAFNDWNEAVAYGRYRIIERREYHVIIVPDMPIVPAWPSCVSLDENGNWARTNPGGDGNRPITAVFQQVGRVFTQEQIAPFLFFESGSDLWYAADK